ncbi:HAMP domain-containing sensor histidine kinase [Clostridium rectalis]|uniref:HAMP domain-containing sensor histidine kinase n=1 Tax=Clostridium rectalis TaxID=2040295 RepID=UPI000F643CB0|nr:HAMP domain-containing sensor histidine kinase [Clostridium rectalis]
MKSKTIKRDFYNLVLKVFIYTVISTMVTYIFIVLVIQMLGNNKPTDYYVKYIHEVAKEVEKNGDSILKGNLIDIKKYSIELQGEVIDLAGNHLYGEEGIKNDNFNILNSINQDKYDNNYIYRYVGITKDNNIKAIYVIKAPFDFIKNNFKTNNCKLIIYSIAMFAPILYFILFLSLFTSKLYKYISKNVDILLNGAEKICEGDLDFHITGVKGEEFNKIQQSFNMMVKTLRSNIKDLSKLDNERRMMVSSIAHDIRTPITVIKGQIEIIEDLKDNPKYKIDDNMSIINKNCDKMTNLTNNLSLLYKVEGECFLLRNEKVDLKKMLQYKELEIKSLTQKKDVTIEFIINLNKEKYILDGSMLFRILDNILYNSLRFTERGKIILEVRDDLSLLNKIIFKCSDTGSGFKQKDTSKLFEAFYQDEDYKNHFGLGLFIAKKIIDNYGGDIKAYNNELGGATIEFYIKELKEYPIS